MKIFQLILLIFLMKFADCLGQEKDTIFLQEVKVTNNANKLKFDKIKTKGSKASLRGKSINKIISRLDNIPAGQLSSIKFYFNKFKSIENIENDKVKFTSIKFGLLILSANSDNTPGTPISNNEINFLIPENYSGPIELDLKPLSIDTSEKMFFGIELFEQQQSDNFVLMTVIDQNYTDAMYVKLWNDEAFQHLELTNMNIKMDLKILN